MFWRTESVTGRQVSGSADEADWSPDSICAVLIRFIETERKLDPLVRERLQNFLDEQFAEECGETTAEKDDEDYDATDRSATTGENP